jgi:hypothetical protein
MISVAGSAETQVAHTKPPRKRTFLNICVESVMVPQRETYTETQETNEHFQYIRNLAVLVSSVLDEGASNRRSRLVG